MLSTPYTIGCVERFFLFPLIGGITAVSGVVAGFAGSRFHSEIMGTFDSFQFTRGSASFFLLTALFGVFFTGTFWAQARSSKRATDALTRATNDVADKTSEIASGTSVLQDLLQQLHTLPPAGFLEDYRRTLRDVDGLAIHQVTTSAECAKVIRGYLIAIVYLAMKFDTDGTQARYSCNLMLFSPSEDLSGQECVSIETRLRFVESGVSVSKLKGILDLMLELSVSSLSKPEPDPSLRALALPIPFEGESMPLPGAPEAFVTQEEVIVEDPSALLKLLKPEHFTDRVRRDLSDYLKEKEDVQSFISIPLFEPDLEPRKVIGVLNLHRDKPNELAAERYELLSPLLVPFLLQIERRLWIYKRAFTN